MFSQSSNPQIPINQTSTTPETNASPEKINDKSQTPPRPSIPPSEEANKKRFKEVLDKKLTPQSAKNPQKTDGTTDINPHDTSANPDELEETDESPKTATLFMLASSSQTKPPFKSFMQNVESGAEVSLPTKSMKTSEHGDLVITSDQATLLATSSTPKAIEPTSVLPVKAQVKSSPTLAKKPSPEIPPPDSPKVFSPIDEKSSFDKEIGDDVFQTIGSVILEKKTQPKESSLFSDPNLQAQAQVQIAPVAQNTNTTLSSGMTDKLGKAQEARIATIELINQMASQMTQMVSNGRTETTITLQHPPIFQGASITITQLESAPKEFNVTFTNLINPTARLLIEMKDNQDSLRSNLIAKGYTLHMVTIEPKLELSTQNTETETGTSFSKRDEKYEESSESDVGTGVT